MNGATIKTELSNLMKIGPVGAELQADGRTDMAKLIVASRNSRSCLKTGLTAVVMRTGS